MSYFVTGTDTDVGKTLVSSWLALHSGYSYYKPIQTGVNCGTDTEFLLSLGVSNIYEESYKFAEPLSPHLAAKLEGKKIDLASINIPDCDTLIVEGAGGVFVPINDRHFILDVMKKFALPVIIVTRSGLGTINHTLLTITAIQSMGLEIAGVVMNGDYNEENLCAIEYYAGIKVLANIPKLTSVSKEALLQIPFNSNLKTMFNKDKV